MRRLPLSQWPSGIACTLNGQLHGRAAIALCRSKGPLGGENRRKPEDQNDDDE